MSIVRHWVSIVHEKNKYTVGKTTNFETDTIKDGQWKKKIKYILDQGNQI